MVKVLVVNLKNNEFVEKYLATLHLDVDVDFRDVDFDTSDILDSVLKLYEIVDAADIIIGDIPTPVLQFVFIHPELSQKFLYKTVINPISGFTRVSPKNVFFNSQA